MSLLDELTTAGTRQVNASIGESRSKVSRGLQNLVMGALPSTNRIRGPLGGFVEAQRSKVTTMLGDGVRQVFDAVSIPYDTKVLETNPRIYRNGISAAQTVWVDINSGTKRVGDIVSTGLEPLTLLKYTDDQIPKFSTESATPLASNSNHPTPYAMDLFRLAPKHKFLFVVEFVFNGGYDFVGQGQRSKNDFAITIKEFDRPKVKYEYEDNVNFYNFRSTVVKRVVHDPLTIKFLDDRQNLAMTFFHQYMKVTHPLTAVEPGSAVSYEDNGMNFEGKINSSSTGVLNLAEAGIHTILKEIKVYHLFDFGSKMNVHHFTNPKVVSIDHDSWNMADSEGSHINSQFTYDGWSMELGVKVEQEQASLIGALSNAGQYQMNPIQQPASGNPRQNDVRGLGLSPGEELVSPRQLQNDSIRASLSRGEQLVTATQLEAEEATRRAQLNIGL